MHSSARILVAPIGGGFFVGLLWLLINAGPHGAGGGWLDQQPWPLSSLYACVAIGAALSLLLALARGRWERRRSEDLSELAAQLGLTYRPQASRDDLAGGAQLRIFSHWRRGWNQLQGRFEGLDVQMVDFLDFESVASRYDFDTFAGSQTVVLLRVPGAAWPIFRIYPRSMATWLWGLLGYRGVRFRFRDERLATAARRAVLRRFHRRYYVFVGAAARIAELAGLDAGLALGEGPLETREIADRFSLDTLRRFSDYPGWNVESCATHVAFWRSGRVLPAAQREIVLREVVGLYRSLAQPAGSAADENVEFEVDGWDSAQLGRRMLGLISGGLVGMVLAMLVGFPILLTMPFEVVRWLVLLWPLLGMASMAAGACLGARLAAGNRHGI